MTDEVMRRISEEAKQMASDNQVLEDIEELGRQDSD